MIGGFAEVAVSPVSMTLRCPTRSTSQGAALVVNYHTAYFVLVTRGSLCADETVLIHGAAGGIGTVAIQVAKALGGRVIAGVSTDDKAAVAHNAGADAVVRSDSDWKNEALAFTGGAGVNLIVDPVGGDRFTDSLRALASGGRLVVVGFASGAIPEVKVNRLLLKNTAVIGAGWASTSGRPVRLRARGRRCDHRAGARRAHRPDHRRPAALEQAAQALERLDAQRATGKIVLEP